VGPVALVSDGLPVGAPGLLTCPALAGPLDVVVGHRALLGLLDGVVQRRVTRRIPTADAGGDLDVLDQPGEHLAAACVDDGLLVLGGGPFGMAAHQVLPLLLCCESGQRVYGDRYDRPVTMSTNSRWMRRSPVISGWHAGGSMRPWRTATMWSPARPSTCTSGPTRSTHGARMNTACTGAGRPPKSMSSSNES